MKRGRKSKRDKSVSEPDLIRFGISIPADLLEKFDARLSERNNQNRSEAIRDLIRDRLIQDAWNEGKGEQIATVTLVYENQSAEFARRLNEAKKTMGAVLVSTLHTRLSGSQDLEVLALRGPAQVIRNQAEGLVALKGVLHGKLVMTSAQA